MKQKRRFFLVLPVLTILLGMAGFALTKDREWVELLKPYGMVIAAFLAAAGFWDIRSKKKQLLGSSCYLLSVLLISLLPQGSLFHWWIVGPVIAALYIHRYVGLAMQGVLTLFLCWLYGYNTELLIFYGITGMLLCILIKYMTSLTSFFYALLIVLSSDLTLIFLVNNLSWKQSLSKGTAYFLLSVVGAVGIAWLLPFGTRSSVVEEEEEEQLLKVLSDDFVLRRRLMEASQELYAHSLYISKTAKKAALFIGCQDKVAEAGGLYHEIGKIFGKNDRKEGRRLGKEAGLPQSVMDIICQHNSGEEKPRSVEAAVVMMTDSIVSIMEHMEKEGKSAEAERIIEKVFDIRLRKGDLDESGMEIRKYRKLREFFLKEYSKGGNV